MKLAQLLAIRSLKKVVHVGTGASREAFYISGFPSEIIKTPNWSPSVAGAPEFKDELLIYFIERYMEGEEREIAKKYATLFIENEKKCCYNMEASTCSANLNICTERLISIIIGTRGNQEKNNFALCKEIIELDGKVYGRYENANYKKSGSVVTHRAKKIYDRSGNLIGMIEDLHQKNVTNGVILDYASLIIPS